MGVIADLWGAGSSFLILGAFLLALSAPVALITRCARRRVRRASAEDPEPANGGKMTRDFVGYGAEPPHAQWPGRRAHRHQLRDQLRGGLGTLLPDGDGVSEGGLTEMLGADLGVTGRDLGAESMFEYGARVGFWRLHRIFTRFHLPVTIFGCARAFEANPPAAAAIAASDWDICSHGYRWTNHPGLPKPKNAAQIAAAVELIRRDHRQDPARLVLPLCAFGEHPPTDWSSMADFSTTATPTMTSCPIGCGSATARISSCPIR